MSKNAKLKAEEKFSGLLKSAKRAMTEQELEKLAKMKQTEKLRELRLAKEAADIEIEDQQKAGMSKTRSKSKGKS